MKNDQYIDLVIHGLSYRENESDRSIRLEKYHWTVAG